MPERDCGFCDPSWIGASDLVLQNEHCLFAASRDPAARALAGLVPDVLPGAGAIFPLAHRTSPFELTPEEWASTRELLIQVRRVMHDELAPDGYVLGWNDGAGLHAHLHVIPRFDDEPLRDKWLRSAINVTENRRPDPWRPGTGRALRSDRQR